MNLNLSLAVLLALYAGLVPQTLAVSSTVKPHSKTHKRPSRSAHPSASSKTHRAATTVKHRGKARRTAHHPAVVVYSKEQREHALESVTSSFRPQLDHLDNPEALSVFFRRLAEAQSENRPIHVLHYGDSHTASDDWADGMRKKFQEGWSDGGPGFVIAGRPFPGCRRFDVSSIASSAGWRTEGTLRSPGDKREGLSGLSITANRPGQTVAITTAGSRLEIWFLRQPLGGSFTIRCDGQSVAEVNSEGTLATGTYALQISEGLHTYTLTTTSYSPVRLFGWISEKSQGITWETLGINGAQIGLMTGWDRQLWKEQIQARDPALVLLAYGTNEALYPLFNASAYRADVAAAVDMIQRAVPNASVLLVGPPADDPHRRFVHLKDVIATQREVAREKNCAFWDWASHMDESGGRAVWVKAGLSQSDYTHLTGAGYRLVGNVLADELLLGYRGPTSSARVR